MKVSGLRLRLHHPLELLLNKLVERCRIILKCQVTGARYWRPPATLKSGKDASLRPRLWFKKTCWPQKNPGTSATKPTGGCLSLGPTGPTAFRRSEPRGAGTSAAGAPGSSARPPVAELPSFLDPKDLMAGGPKRTPAIFGGSGIKPAHEFKQSGVLECKPNNYKPAILQCSA